MSAQTSRGTVEMRTYEAEESTGATISLGGAGGGGDWVLERLRQPAVT